MRRKSYSAPPVVDAGLVMSRTAYEPPLPSRDHVCEQHNSVVNSKLSVDTPHINSGVNRGAQLHQHCVVQDDVSGAQIMVDEETPSTATGSSTLHRQLSFIHGDLGQPLEETPALRRALSQV